MSGEPEVLVSNLDPAYGTEALVDAKVDYVPFDAKSPGEVGAVAFAPYEGPLLSQQGHVVLYAGAHSTIQALVNPGVTEDYDDIWTNAHIGRRYYGYLRVANYSADGAPPVDTTGTIAPA